MPVRGIKINLKRKMYSGHGGGRDDSRRHRVFVSAITFRHLHVTAYIICRPEPVSQDKITKQGIIPALPVILCDSNRLNAPAYAYTDT